MRSSTARCTAGHHENCCKCMKAWVRTEGYSGGDEEHFRSSKRESIKLSVK